MPKKAKKYTEDQINEAWEAYRGQWCFKYTRGGKTYINHQKPSNADTRDGVITKIERVRYNHVMSFPKFLRTIHG